MYSDEAEAVAAAAAAKESVTDGLERLFAWLHREVGYAWSFPDSADVEKITDALEAMIDAKIAAALRKGR